MSIMREFEDKAVGFTERMDDSACLRVPGMRICRERNP